MNNINEEVSIHYKKFFDRFSEIETLPIEEWEILHIIAYFCKRYKNHYGVEYTFKFSSTAPSKSYETITIKKLSHMLSSNPNILKDYIDDFFQDKIIAKKKRITSMAFLIDTNVVNSYKFSKLAVSKNTTINRSTTIPTIYLNAIKKYDDSISNYGELAFIKKYAETSEDIKYKDILNALINAGMDLNILDKVK